MGDGHYTNPIVVVPKDSLKWEANQAARSVAFIDHRETFRGGGNFRDRFVHHHCANRWAAISLRS
ncbi:MAG TPA: hypothetical protein VFE46_15360 [Pirellulales bacterium]|nr:hypothetical protein [Pirellulales bacterium]